MIYRDFLDSRALEQYASWLNGRARRAGASGELNASQLRDRILESGGRCEWCDRDLVGSAFELDHIISLKQTGSHKPENLAVACPACNRRKAKKHPARFAAEIYSETGKKTRLVRDILADSAASAARQTTMFEADSLSKESRIEIDDQLSSLPPFHWND